MVSALNAIPTIALGDTGIPRAVAYLPRLQEEGVYRDCTLPQERIGISAARLAQDPLAEACQLWHEDPIENGLFRLQLHRLQHVVRADKLKQTFRETLTDVVAKAGVQVNRIRRSHHMATVLPFVSGLGPHKAPIFMKCMTT